jgi:hypothetical protein
VASSISNSETFTFVRNWPATWLAVLMIALAFSLTVCWSSFSWFRDPNVPDMRLAAVQTQAISVRPNARVLILGNSRAAFGLVPTIIERSLARPPLDVANWAYPFFGRPDHEILVNNNRSIVAAADLVAIAIDPWFALEAPIRTAPEGATLRGWSALVPLAHAAATRNWAADGEKMLRQWVAWIAPVGTRMAWFFQTLGARLKLIPPYQFTWAMLPTGNWETAARSIPEGDPYGYVARLAERRFKDQNISQAEVFEWHHLLRALKQLPAKKLVLFYLPLPPSFTAAERIYQDVVDQNRNTFATLAEENNAFLMYLTADECGLSDHMFGDPVHVNRIGREILSECFAAHLRRVID